MVLVGTGLVPGSKAGVAHAAARSVGVDTTVVDSLNPRVQLSFETGPLSLRNALVYVEYGPRAWYLMCTDYYAHTESCAATLTLDVPLEGLDIRVSIIGQVVGAGASPTPVVEPWATFPISNVGWTGAIETAEAVYQNPVNSGQDYYQLHAVASKPLASAKAEWKRVADGAVLTTCYAAECNSTQPLTQGLPYAFQVQYLKAVPTGPGTSRWEVADQREVVVLAGRTDEKRREALDRLLYAAAEAGAGSLTVGQLMTAAASVDLATAPASLAANSEACYALGVATGLDEHVILRISQSDITVGCLAGATEDALATAITNLIIGLGASVVAEFRIEYATAMDPATIADASPDPAECDPAYPTSTPCNEAADDLGRVYEDAHLENGIWVMYATPDQPWESAALKPYSYCGDGSSGWSCGDAAVVSYVFYELGEDDEWVPQPASAGSMPPGNCLFLDDDGNLKLYDDGTVDTSARDARVDELLSQEGLTNTYETHHIVTQFANANDPAKAEVVRNMVDILTSYGLGVSGSFNKVVIPHEGPHPVEYHRWVLAKMREIRQEVGGDTGEFLRLFDERVTQQILFDPTIVLTDYWECRR